MIPGLPVLAGNDDYTATDIAIRGRRDEPSRGIGRWH